MNISLMQTKIKGLGKLIRINKPIGFFLLLWPTLSAFFILTRGNPSPSLLVIFCLGTFLMRSAGCVINDYFDRNFDGRVERTKTRPLVTGEVKPNEALLFFVILLSLSASLLYWTNKLTFKMALIGAFITCLYPLTKRFFQIPQMFLGIAFSWGIIMVCSAELNTISPSSIILFFACFFWIMAYDTAYAMSDRDDDLFLDIHSSALTFGNYAQYIFLICQIISLSLWAIGGFMQEIKPIYYFLLLIVFFFIFYQFRLIKEYDRQNCFKAFINNNWIGISIFIGSILGTVL